VVGARRARRRRAVAGDERAEDRVDRPQVRQRGLYGWPSTAPGTPVFVEYAGCSFICGRR
jgi:hypothetical protein